jgi:hypothetical protein
MDAKQANEILQHRTISRIEAGSTPGWIVVFFQNTEPKIDNEEPVELYMTVFVGGSKFDYEKWLHYSNCALHVRAADGRSVAHNIRDYSTAMPIAAANTITMKRAAICDAPDVGQWSRYGHCTRSVADDGMMCQEHYEKSENHGAVDSCEAEVVPQ